MAFLSIILGTFLWSVDTLIRYPLLERVNPTTMVLIEHLFLVLYFIPLLFINQFSFKKINASHLLAFVVIGVVGSAASTLAFTKAFSLVNPSLVILLQKLQPFVAISLSSLILKEKLKLNFFLYGTIAFIGALMISLPDILPLFTSANDVSSAPLIGYALALFAVVGWGASTVYGKQLSLKEFSESEIMAGRFIFGFIFLTFYATATQAWPTTDLSYEVYLKILVMVFLSGLLGMYLYYRGLRQLPAHTTAIAELFFPLSAVAVNWIVLGQSLKPLQIAGGIILMGASAMIQKSKV
jgi:drug/metabolite transporter (DMT)-like permease